MSYETAPATILLATHCAACARPLVDAKSVETGMGPDCRAKHGFNIAVSDEARTEANKLVWTIAHVQEGAEAFAACQRLQELGFHKLAARIMDRLVSVTLTLEGDRLMIAAPYAFDFVFAVKAINGRRWHKEEKQWSVPTTPTARQSLHDALCRSFAGAWALGPKGPFVLG